INTGGWGLWLKTEDLAKVGKLLLDKGQWHGKQIIPAGWVETMSARHVGSVQGTPNSEEAVPSEEDLLKSDWVQGYGYQVWRCRHNAFRADGSLGQFIVVIPDVDAVVAMTANSHTYQQQMNLIWDYILPFLEREKQKNM
ncbi:MAG: serine hydrolase, partial [Muribaculaceae bacterium]|nr:serine hydrolase [Muribaculaceae bacterium]